MDNQFINLTAQIVSAHVANNLVAPQQLPNILREVHQALATAVQTAVASQKPERPEPAVAVKKSVFADHILCLDCGGSFKLLKRHLAADHQMTPEEYRARWELPPSYPVVAPDYAARRSQLARDRGLGLSKVDGPEAKKRSRSKRN